MRIILIRLKVKIIIFLKCYLNCLTVKATDIVANNDKVTETFELLTIVILSVAFNVKIPFPTTCPTATKAL